MKANLLYASICLLVAALMMGAQPSTKPSPRAATRPSARKAQAALIQKPCRQRTHDDLSDEERRCLKRAFMITDPKVIDSPRAQRGAWSFKHLITRMAPKGKASEFVKRWLLSWDKKSQVNGFPLPRRAAMRTLLIERWKAADGKKGVPDSQWQPNLDHAPFKLLAIVSRLDLHKASSPSVPKDAGEGRFVFAVLPLDPSGQPSKISQEKRFTVIFEYKLTFGRISVALPLEQRRDRAREELKKWAQDWFDLCGHKDFDEAYKSALQRITDRFGVGSALGQIRTNEVLLAAGGEADRRGNAWELREFILDKSAPKQRRWLKIEDVKQTPAESFKDASKQKPLTDFIKKRHGAILKGEHQLERRMRGGHSIATVVGVAPLKLFSWSQVIGAGLGVPNEAKVVKQLSTFSCNGCHGGDVDPNPFDKSTFPFQHIRLTAFDPQRNVPTQVGISRFLREKDLPARICEHKELLELMTPLVAFSRVAPFFSPGSGVKFPNSPKPSLVAPGLKARAAVTRSAVAQQKKWLIERLKQIHRRQSNRVH